MLRTRADGRQAGDEDPGGAARPGGDADPRHGWPSGTWSQYVAGVVDPGLQLPRRALAAVGQAATSSACTTSSRKPSWLRSPRELSGRRAGTRTRPTRPPSATGTARAGSARAIPADATPPDGPPPAEEPPPPPPAPAARRRPPPPGRRGAAAGRPGTAGLHPGRRLSAARRAAAAAARSRRPACRCPADARPQARPHGLPLAALGARFVARLIDIVAVLLLNVVVNGWFVYQLLAGGRADLPRGRPADDRGQPLSDVMPTSPSRPQAGTLQLVMLFVATALWFAYEVPGIANTGQTLGKRLLGSRWCGWRAPSRSASAARSAAGTGSACRRCCWCCCGLGFVCCSSSTALSPLFDRQLQQALHDKAARTVVVAGRRTDPASRRPPRQEARRRPAMTRLTRADLDALPSYVPGRSPPTWPASWASRGDQAGQQRGAVRPAARRGGGGRRGRRRRAPLPGHGRGRAARRARRAVRRRRPTGSPPAAARWRWPSTWPRRPACPATRSSTRGARSRRTRSSRRPPARPACACPTPPATATTCAAMAAAITDRTRLVLVCNPNNPTGTAVRRAELDRFLDAVPSDVLVVLDEAYREFVTDPDVPDGLEAYGDRPNVVVLRTLSKAWGLAGLRVGFLVAQPEVAAAVRKVVTPFSTSAGRPGRGAGRAARPRTRYGAAARSWSPSASGSPRRVRKLCPDVPAQPGQLRLAAAGRPGRPSSARPARSSGVIVRPFQPATASGSRSARRRRTTPSSPRRRPSSASVPLPGRDGCRHG